MIFEKYSIATLKANHIRKCYDDIRNCHFFIGNKTGKTKDAINGTTYFFLVSTFVTIQAFAEWKKYQIKSTSASKDSQMTVGGVVRKTGDNFVNM